MKKTLLKKLAEPSTYAGLMGMAILLGMPEGTFTNIVGAIAGVAGFVLAITAINMDEGKPQQ